MATSQQFLVCDSSTLTNFKAWAQAISSFFSTAGWLQSSDTGQVNWSTISAVPGSGAFVYEIWQPNDGLTNFYVKVEYGNFSGTNCPSLRFTLSTTTNGAGTPTGIVSTVQNTNSNAFTAPSTTTQYECDFSGAAGRIGAIMWRNGINGCQQLFAIERSINASGTYTSSYVTIVVGGVANTSASNSQTFNQQSLVFGVGAGPTATTRAYNGYQGPTLCVRSAIFDGMSTTAFNGSIPFDTVSPVVGYFDYPMTMVGAAYGPDFVEGITFSVTLYGSTRTYMPTKSGPMAWQPTTNVSNGIICLRYD